MLNINRLRLQDRYIPTNSLVAKVAGAIAVFVGSLVLVGWCFGIEVLKRGFPGSPATMKVNTALCFVLCGVSLWLFLKAQRSRGERTIENSPHSSLLISRVCGIAVTTIAALTLCEYLFGWNLGIDELLFRDSPTSIGTLHPGRMGANTALNFMLVSVALQILIHPKTHRSYWYAQIIAGIATLISFQALMGYAYKVKVLYGVAPYTTSMALHTAVLFLLLSIGILWAQAEEGLMRVVTSDTDGGLLARHLLIAAIAVLFGLGWIIVEGQRAGQYDPAFAVSVFAIVLIVIFTILIWQSARAEQALLNQQKWLEDVLNLMPRPLLFIEPGTARVTFANRSANELAGGEFPKGVPAAEYHTVYHYTDAAGDRIPNQQMPGVRVALGERLNGLEVDWHTPGGVRSLLVFADTLPAMHGHPATCILVFQEISNLKQAQKALSLGYKRLKLLFDTANDLLSSQQPVVLIDSVYRKLRDQIALDIYFNYLVEDNSQVMRLRSYSGISQEMAKEIECLAAGEGVCGSVAQKRHPIAVENVQQSTEEKTELIRSLGITAYYAYPLIAQGRLLGTLSFGSRTLLSFTENQLGMMQAVCDQIAIAMERASLIASLQQQTEQLQEANRMKDEFLGILSHELRSPLNAILGWAQLLQRSKLSETLMARAVETIERNAKAQTQLIEDLLDISRMIRGKLRLNVGTCNLVLMIESAIETVRLAAQCKEIDLRFSLIPSKETRNAPPGILPVVTFAPNSDLRLGINHENLESREAQSQTNQHSESSKLGENSQFLVSGDFERLQQIIWNLLSNAIKFTPVGGRVEVQLSLVSEQSAQIQVIDTGIGISPDFLPYVFHRFRQADSSNTRLYGGLGLGLAIVSHLVELHGGTVYVNSPGKEQGATFTVKIPLLKSQAFCPCAPLPLSPPLPLSLFGVRVLVVDHQADTREFMITVLQQCQAEVQAVASVEEALQIIIQWKPDVLVSDIGIPQEDGYSLIRKLRSQPPELGGNIPAAALTAYARAEDRMRAIQEGYQLHLPKPIEAAELATVVASLVGRT
ncbi:MAG: ATP-binding protein [Nostoc sp.]|uniref:hybrid sensor histidine kinase/response regulator n=1 Tax=Nostoc sp. TaxID=1180 RepID=UPI002FFAD260